jgi:hypothetical protein
MATLTAEIGDSGVDGDSGESPSRAFTKQYHAEFRPANA